MRGSLLWLAVRAAAAARAHFEELKGRLAGLKKRLEGVLETDLGEFDKTVQEQGIPLVAALPREERK